MQVLHEIETLKRVMHRLAERHGSLTHKCVVRVSQLLDQKLNEYEQIRRCSPERMKTM
ncbi:aspartyl-phosphate phosphatase Spo0E family protein [Paenibacillus ginsengarvi]|uniref:Aspartyl-phosphate phosphatase Spo0E family protein n=1 Tax=Paenibacillus ginsengarvi TaxID=400777 RepID=A0A3B0AXF9_9BACL|nr:aspartyl-phosphate phosphatase Spo0E family protein [Paenibacillus ginsengarvi]RKN65150.1 aspartyl-phosphate phosphatase Spo0E family protein [Paenibacillus ginsengarvi]